MNIQPISFFAFLSLILVGCSKESSTPETDWTRHEDAVFRDLIPEENYQSASDGHIFFDESGELKMIYSGDVNGISSIKLASGSNWTNWSSVGGLLTEIGPSGSDKSKETSFYRLAENGKHQIYYIGYSNEETYQSEIYVAEADQIEGPYTQANAPLVPRGSIAGKEVYCMTSPSIVEHEEKLYLSFLGWNASPNEVTEVWVLGAISEDDGETWGEFQEVDSPIGMEGQVTKGPDGKFYAVRTDEFQDIEAIYYAESNHPFGPWITNETPIITKSGSELEKDEVIAPQITFDPVTGQKHLYYTGADHLRGWWMMMATEPQ